MKVVSAAEPLPRVMLKGSLDVDDCCCCCWRTFSAAVRRAVLFLSTTFWVSRAI